MTKPLHVPSTASANLNILGIPMLIRIHGRDTSGAIAVVESQDLAGGGPPMHVHAREEETFQVLQGEYEFSVDGKSIVARTGDTVFAPRGVPHTYRYVGKPPGRLLCFITPAGFEGFFEAIAAMSGQQQQDIPRVIEIAKKFGLEILPPPTTSG